tara:strand:- start:284 stop:433 length:150 start_codon:yes stop_codon:yes gene_type:complete
MRKIKKRGNVRVNPDPEAPYHTPKGTPSEVQELLRRGWVKKGPNKVNET